MTTKPDTTIQDQMAIQAFFAENVLIINRDFACAVGVNEAFVLSQIRYWIKSNAEHKKRSHFRDEHWWTYNTYEDWRRENFPWMSVNTIRRAIERLEQLHIIVSTSIYNKRAYDETKWYTINTSALLAFMNLWYTHLKPVRYTSKKQVSPAYEAFMLDWNEQYNNLKYGHFEITDAAVVTVSPIEEKAAANNGQGGAQYGQHNTIDYYREQKEKNTLTNVNGHNSNNEKNTLQEDASTPTHEQSPHTTEAHPPIPADAQPPSRPRKADLDAQYDAIAETWNTSTSGLITNLRGMLFGSVNVRGEWKQNAIAPALSIDELRAFAAYAKRRMLETTNGRNQDMPTKAVTIALWVEQFRRERADAQAREQERVVLVADETPMDAGAGAGARVTAQQGVDVSAIPF